MVRIKNRYLLVNILYPELDSKKQDSAPLPDIVLFNQPSTNVLTAQILVKGIRAEILDLFGDYGSGAVAESLNVKYFSLATSTFILRVSRSHYRLAWAALTLMNKVPVKDGKNCVFRVVRVSGTIRKAEEEAIRRARELILKTQREMVNRGESTLDSIFGKDEGKSTARDDAMMVDAEISEGGEDTEGDG